MKKTKFADKIGYWFPLAIVTTIICGCIYVTVQQDMRTSANDPQIQMAEDAAAALESGSAIQTVLPIETTRMDTSLAPYMMIFADDGKLRGSSVVLNTTIPTVPEGVFNTTRQQTETRFTWEPADLVRSAAVVVYYTDGAHDPSRSGFVLVGRSLREVEKREDSLTMEVGAAWVAALSISFIAAVALL